VPNRWLLGARPRTLPAAVVPVVVGTAAASASGSGDVIAWRAAAALVVALAIQVATNYANDYSDGIRGTDEVRTGPPRLVGGGLAAPASVRRAALLSFAVAGIAGLALTFAVGPELLIVGAASFAAGWLYTGGPRPYGYMGLGEVFVFVFFGLVATVGSAYVQTSDVTALAVLAAVPVGLLAVALLVVNNLRDIPGDTTSGKQTLAVRIGDGRTRVLYVALLVIACLAVFPIAVAAGRAWVLIALLASPLAVPPARQVLGRAAGRALIPVLQDTGRLQLVFGLLLALGLAL
jgi:1,4-dihydroxy-2-naphthoate octaprenyltransferase